MPQTRFPQIQTLLPHRAPMLLLERILDASSERLWCLVRTDACPDLVEAAGIPSNLAMEYLAQAGALLLGLHAPKDPTTPPTPGLLVACARLSCSTPFLDPEQALVAQVAFAASVPSRASGLVRLRGELASFPLTTANSIDPGGWVARWPDQPAAAAELSVYLPSSAAPSTATRAQQ